MTQPRAVKRWERWTHEEIVIALDSSRTARVIALELGRTAKGVEKVRRTYKRRWSHSPIHDELRKAGLD